MELNIKEYTQDEFNQLVESRNYEVFSAESVTAFCEDTLEKSKKEEIDEFEKSCAVADFASLTPAIVVGKDLIKRTFYYRESQTEAVEIPEGIFKSIDDKMCRKYKETELNILKGIAGINCADEDAIEKAKTLPIGTEKTYGGKLYVKTEKGWRLKAKGTGKRGLATDKETQEKRFIENLVTAYKEHGKDSVQFQTAMLAPKNAYKDEKEINRFLGKLSAAIESETKKPSKEKQLDSLHKEGNRQKEESQNKAAQFEKETAPEVVSAVRKIIKDYEKNVGGSDNFDDILKYDAPKIRAKYFKGKGISAKDLKVGDTVHANSNSKSALLTYQGKDDKGRHLFKNDKGEIEKVKSENRLFYKKEDALNESNMNFFIHQELLKFSKEESQKRMNRYAKEVAEARKVGEELMRKHQERIAKENK